MKISRYLNQYTWWILIGLSFVGLGMYEVSLRNTEKTSVMDVSGSDRSIASIKNKNDSDLVAHNRSHQENSAESSSGEIKEPLINEKQAGDNYSLQLKKYLKRASDLKNCYEPQVCAFPQMDPRSYELALGQALVELLDEYLSYSLRTGEGANELQDLARELLESFDGHVQAAALTVLKEFPISGESVEALGKALRQTPEPSVMALGLEELKRYMGTSYEYVVHETLQNILQEGGHFVGQEVAKELLPFLTEQSRQKYNEVLASLPPASAKAQTLRAILEEYDRLKSGG